MKKGLMTLLLMIIMFPLVWHPSPAHASVNISDMIMTSLGATNAGVSIRDSETGQILYQFNGNTPRKPASTLKLLTGAATLSLLGEQYRYHTSLYIDGSISKGTLNGNVYMKGSGDPTLQYTQLLAFADALKNKGITKVNGNLYGDERIFSGSPLTPGIVAEDESDYYAARTSGLVLSPDNDFDAGTMIVRVAGEKVGQKPSVSFIPSTMGMTIITNAKTVSSKSMNTITVSRKYRTSEVIISGNIPAGKWTQQWVTVNDPTINTVYALKEAMKTQGMTFVETSAIDRGEIPENATFIATHESQTLKEMFPVFMKLSNNSMADIFVKTLGAEVHGVGDTQTGINVLRDFGQTIGLDMSNWTFEDGSGISHNNKVSPNDLTALLYHVRDMEAYHTYYQALPVGGNKERLTGGSLRDRYTNASTKLRVVAKTGALTGVNTLAGYVKAKSGKTYIFSIMTENRSAPAIDEIDTVVSHLINKY
ncbi:D-alanyl-D-alanine carboxypeptidase/D-alanyl-D-alanine-endopeptidase [Lysinibacillus sp. KU-BSD001]|uniref:D-alanyl-D-alanine carboxypeptidase/D-alanyl-D-alanine endopeptidase n=1 Tax=Lysinibacillus sp. KU-BSD001 TaxID=3141328 RepID=UPI0036E1DD9C